MEVRAIARAVQISPRKVRLVGNAVKGMPVWPGDRRPAVGAEQGRRPDRQGAEVGALPTRRTTSISPPRIWWLPEWSRMRAAAMKRWRARARGRAAPLIKRSSHITVVVVEREA